MGFSQPYLRMFVGSVAPFPHLTHILYHTLWGLSRGFLSSLRPHPLARTVGCLCPTDLYTERSTYTAIFCLGLPYATLRRAGCYLGRWGHSPHLMYIVYHILTSLSRVFLKFFQLFFENQRAIFSPLISRWIAL